ncbi:MAG: glycerophosphodiester phosphodiesterase [Promethearchaeota archaeon]
MVSFKIAMIVFAHRGASGYAPDNTLKAFNKAIELGTNAIESDVKITFDGKVVFFHDFILKIKHVIPIPIFLIPFNKLTRYQLGDRQRVPRVSEIFHYYKKKGLLDELIWSLDIPNSFIFKKLVKICRKYQIEKNILACHNNHKYFKQWKKISQSMNLVWSIRLDLIKKLSVNGMIKIAKKLHVDIINLKVGEANQNLCNTIRNSGFSLFIWDVHDEKRYRKAISLKPDAIYSNYPDKALTGNWHV